MEPGEGASAGPGRFGRAERRGSWMARALAGSWRPEPPPPSLSVDELNEVTPLLLRSGAGALAWWRLRHSELRNAAPARMLRDAYRLHTLDARRQLLRLNEATALLTAAGVEPLVAKGWTVARFYRARIKGCVKERRRTFPLTANQRIPG